jgi:hypothetical protein
MIIEVLEDIDASEAPFCNILVTAQSEMNSPSAAVVCITALIEQPLQRACHICSLSLI